MLKKFFQIFFVAAMTFVPIVSFAGGIGGAGEHMKLMDQATMGRGGIGPILMILFFVALLSLVITLIKATGDFNKRSGQEAP